MHSQAMIRMQTGEDARERDHAVRLARIAGVAYPERRVEPELTATVRFGDPNLAELYRKQARNDLVGEAIAKLEAVEPETEDAPLTSLEDIDGVTPEVAANLRAAGYETPGHLAEASDEDLLAVDGIGPKKLAAIREALRAEA